MHASDQSPPGHRVSVGSLAVDFELPEARGGHVRLSAVLRDKVAVLVFYRGGWCPFCSRQIASLVQDYPRFRALGAEILAISHETVTKGRELLERLGPPFKLLQDPQGLAIQAYDMEIRRRDALGFLKRKSHYAHPGVFLVDQEGLVRWKFVGRTFRDRPSNLQTLDALKHIGSPPRIPEAPTQLAETRSALNPLQEPAP